MSLLEGLNPTQREVVQSVDGPVMVLAGAGSGKTRTLVSRICYLIEERRVSPYKILALTFSNKAAKEMRDRIGREVPFDIGALQVTTFHSFCARVLRSEAAYLGLSKSFTIYDTSESKSIAKAILSRRGIGLKEISPYEILYYIDDLKNHGFYRGRKNLDPDFKLDTGDIFYGFYEEYESELHKANSLDFGSLITAVIELFEKNPEVLKRYQERYDYVLVDEYQDTNRAQFDLVKLLSDIKRNLCVVGDEDQSIYSWRGADIRNILDFESNYPEAKIIKLEQNYRSSKTIIEAASALIARNEMRKGKTMWTDNPDGEAIQIIECLDDKKEAEFIATEIFNLKSSGVIEKDIAVFYRTNGQSRLIEDYLRRARLSYRVIGGVKFYERKEIKDMLAYLRLLVNPKDNLAISRIINVPARGIGATSLRKIEGEAIEKGCSLYEILVRICEASEEFKHIRLSAKVKSAIQAFVSLLQEAKVMVDNEILPSNIYEKILHESGYYENLKSAKDYESMARIENLDELGNALKQFEDIERTPNLVSFLETVTLDSFVEEEESTGGEISLMTVHGAKGLEFPYVFVSGNEENVFPSYKSLEDGEGSVEEERRLFYVAMTRAMKRLYLVFAQGRMLFGQVRFNGPSRFLSEIPPKFYSWERKAAPRSQFQESSSYSFSAGNDDDFNQSQSYDDDGPVIQTSRATTSKAPPKVEFRSKFKTGELVVHSLYGKGKVLDSEGHGQDEKVTVQFHDGARKKFMVKFAPLVSVS